MAPTPPDPPPEPAAKRPPGCPLCGRPRDPRWRPFCSRACRDRDLLAWLGGRYAIGSVEIEGEAETTPPPPPEK